jgi:hypothetical protein
VRIHWLCRLYNGEYFIFWYYLGIVCCTFFRTGVPDGKYFRPYGFCCSFSTQLCHYGEKATLDDMSMNGQGCVIISSVCKDRLKLLGQSLLTSHFLSVKSVVDLEAGISAFCNEPVVKHFLAHCSYPIQSPVLILKGSPWFPYLGNHHQAWLRRNSHLLPFFP